MIKEVEFIVSGEVQSVGYRQYVAKVGRKLKLVGFAENLKDGTVRIRCRGEEKAISEFKKQINVKKPDVAPLIDVEDVRETQLVEGKVTQTIFEEKYSATNAEMAQGFSAGMNYMNLFREKTEEKFDHMDKKYDKISEGMFAVVATMEKRMEKTDKNIESLLKALVQKKS